MIIYKMLMRLNLKQIMNNDTVYCIMQKYLHSFPEKNTCGKKIQKSK